MIKRAMILAAGFGKRIHPLTFSCPKPLLKIGEETLLSNTIKFLEACGIKEIIINTHYLSEQIVNYINKNQFNSNIKIIKEKKILDTGGGILNALKFFSDDPFLTINPDTIWNNKHFLDLKMMQKIFFKDKKNKCTLLLVDKKKSFDKTITGDFNLKKKLIFRDRKNKNNYIYTGLQIIRPQVFKNLNKNFFSINLVWNKLILNEEISGVESVNDFLHVSDLSIYKKIIKRY